ncbi:efflux RND transporter periplasmic adaptor subunit [Thalassotalea marina]|uniref:Membrane protein n=1 Tax=Thalassotalea marina TaxID=1673741 RepID=A0A919BKM8_9GAMM|nr:efflux RND transporter periplasmic adaptor subunit [Thalassotalea marina]GHF97654.1 membrane protein [Thalassotalea marina]
MHFSHLLNFIRLIFVSLIAITGSGCDNESTTVIDAQKQHSEKENLASSLPLPVEHTNNYQFYSVVTGFSSTLPSFFEAGRIESVKVVEGQFVDVGQVLATLYSPNLSKELTKAYANREKAKAKFNFSQEDKLRGKELVKRGVISQQAFEQITRTFAVDKQEVKQAQARVEQLETQLNNLQIVAKESGVVARLFKRDGDFIDAGQPMLRFESTNRLKASYLVPEKVATKVPLGTKATMYFTALDKSVEVVAIERALPTQVGVALHKLTFELVNPQEQYVGLKSVLSLTVDKSTAFQVDYRTIRYTPSGQSYVVKLDNELTKVPVTLIDLTDTNAVIKANILASDKLLLNSEINIPMNLSSL